MEIFVLIFVTILPVVFLVWTLKFKTELALLAIAPLAMLFLIVFSINSDNILTYTHNICFDVRTNATATTNSTLGIANATYGNDVICREIQDRYTIPPSYMQILNISMLTFALIVMVIVIRRAIISIEEKRRDDEG